MKRLLILLIGNIILLSAQNSDSLLLDKIKIFPNPYYGHSEYTFPKDSVQIIQLPTVFCTINIYSLKGNLVKQIKKRPEDSVITWDFFDTRGEKIPTGIYKVQIIANGLGEKELKAYFVLRPGSSNF